MRRAYIVTGPESSGTRLMTRIMSTGDTQRDDQMITGADSIAIHRSVPHGGNNPDLAGMVNRLRGKGYDVRAVVMIRDPFATVQSHLRIGHSRSYDEAHKRISDALTFIFLQFAHTRTPVLAMSYEALVSRPELVQHRIAAHFQKECVLLNVHDGNEKYYAA